MVGVMGVGQYDSTSQDVFKWLAGHMVIDAPSQVLGPGIGTVAPSCILMRLVIEIPESIDKPAVDKPAHPFPFFR